MNLLSRSDFRNAVFERDGYRCVVCGEAAQDAHHIIERRLWSDGGYYLENGVSLCGRHHIEAEKTTLSCGEIRNLAGIKTVAIPKHFYRDLNYDKWGNVILPSGKRLKGELFYDESVQKILADVLDLFETYVKYPRTYHLPFSPGLTKDDRQLLDTSHFDGKEVVVTVKMDGENTTLYNDYLHARSIDGRNHSSRNWIKNFHSKIAHDIPDGWRLCGENLFAKHSIHYRNLDSYFYLFSIWNDKNECLSWDETIEWAKLLGLVVVPVLYRGVWDEDVVRGIHQPTFEGNTCEGFVVRLSNGFPYGAFRRSVAKYVRSGHVGTNNHWMFEKIQENELK